MPSQTTRPSRFDVFNGQQPCTLVSQQNAAFERLVATFIEDVSIQGPFTSKEIALLDPATYVCSGLLMEHLVGWFIEETETSEQEQLMTLGLCLPLLMIRSARFVFSEAMPTNH